MKNYNSLPSFYASDDWEACKAQVLRERLKDGKIFCENCGELITKSFNAKEQNNAEAMVFHHKIFLTASNVNNADISINPKNIAILHWKCHNIVHGRFCAGSTANKIERKVYLITGAPLSGKTTFVKDRMQEGDLVFDIDDLWQILSGQPRYTKPNSLKPMVFNIRAAVKEQVAIGAGTWRNAYIIEGLPLAMDRKREAERYKAHNTEIITMKASREECLNRLYSMPNGRDIKAYEEHINNYFNAYTHGNY